MAEGDELPPVVAALVLDDASFLETIARDVEMANQFKAELQAALSGAGEVTGPAGGGEATAGAVEQAQAASEAYTEMAASADEALAQVEAASESFFAELEASAQASTQAVVGESVEFSEAFDQAFAAVRAGAMSAQTAMYALAGAQEELGAETATLSRSINTMRGSWQAAAAATDQAGTSEANLALTTNVLTDAQAQLADANTVVMLAFQQLAAGAEPDLDAIGHALQDVADAQKLVTETTLAQVEAMTELNLAAVQGEAVLAYDANAMAGYAAVSDALGMDIERVTVAIEEGNTFFLQRAAATAQATMQADLLAAAEQRLAAAQMTLVQLDQQMAAGTAISTEAQEAAIAGVKSAQSDVNALSGSMGRVESATKEASGAFSNLGAIMYGPLGMAAFGLMSVLPLVTGLFHSGAASAAEFTSAVQQDSNAVGDNTTTTIQQTLAKSNLSAISKQLGVSQAQLIEYAAGEANVQQQLNAAYDKQVDSLTKASEAQDNYNHQASKVPGGSGPNKQLVDLTQQKQALDQVTSAVQQAIAQDDANSQALLAAEQTTQIYNAAVRALGDGMLQQTEQTLMQNQATAEYGDRLLAAQSTTQYMAAAVGAAGVQMELSAHNTEIANLATVQYGDAVMGAYRDTTMFNAALDASYTSMQIQAQSAAMSSVGLLDLGDSQSGVNRTLAYAEESYSQAQQGAQAYSTALTALNGTTSTLLGSEASFTIALGGLKQALDQNGRSLDVNNVKGAANVQAMTQIASSAQQAAVAVYQNEVSTKGATQAYTDANAKLAQEKQAFIDAADKAGYNKAQVKALADQLYQLPKNIPVNLTVNDSSVLGALSATQQLASALRNMPAGNIPVIGSRAIPGRAGGGSVDAGQLYRVNEEGQEGYFVPPADGYIVPHNAMAALASGTGGGSGGGGGSPNVTVHVYLDSREITSTVRATAQQDKTRNSLTGFI